MNNPPVQLADTIRRLVALKGTPDCVPYCEHTHLGGKEALWVSIYGTCSTAEVFVELTDHTTTRVQSFHSRHKNCPPEIRRKDLSLVDVSDAFALARTMRRRWPEPNIQKPRKRFTGHN